MFCRLIQLTQFFSQRRTQCRRNRPAPAGDCGPLAQLVIEVVPYNSERELSGSRFFIEAWF
jgi:hypothetical protein